MLRDGQAPPSTPSHVIALYMTVPIGKPVRMSDMIGTALPKGYSMTVTDVGGCEWIEFLHTTPHDVKSHSTEASGTQPEIYGDTMSTESEGQELHAMDQEDSEGCSRKYVTVMLTVPDEWGDEFTTHVVTVGAHPIFSGEMARNSIPSHVPEHSDI